MNDGLLIEIVHGSHDPILEFLFGRDADVAEDGAGKFREEALDEVEPGAVLGSEGEFKAVRGLIRQTSTNNVLYCSCLRGFALVKYFIVSSLGNLLSSEKKLYQVLLSGLV